MEKALGFEERLLKVRRMFQADKNNVYHCACVELENQMFMCLMILSQLWTYKTDAILRNALKDETKIPLS